MMAANPGAEASLPPLREDIEIGRAPRRADGAPGYVLHDPAANAFYLLGWVEFEIVSRWQVAPAEALVADINRTTTLRITPDEVRAVERFLAGCGLLRRTAAEIRRDARPAASPTARLTRLLGETLLFRRIPLIAPQAFLRRTLPLVSPLFTVGFCLLIALSYLVGGYLAARQWPILAHDLRSFYSFEGAIGVALALTVAKSAHELAHAYAAVRYGAGVPSMGVMLIAFWPVLYTETSSAWLLPDRRHRLVIAAAGVLAEVALAGFALVAWSFVDPGPVRNMVLFAATSVVAMSVLINANPLMRFDGYFVISEVLGAGNLQPRAVDLATHHMRRWATGARLPDPEPQLDRGGSLALAAYGFALLLYRVVLYSGIAVLLYLMLFPALGIPLFLAVIATFLVVPAMRELVVWHSLSVRRHGRLAGAARFAAVLTLLVLPLLVPWRATVMVPVAVSGGDLHPVFATSAGRIEALLAGEGDPVRAGMPLMSVASPDLELGYRAKRAKARTLEMVLRRHLTNAKYGQGRLVREGELATLATEIDGIGQRLAGLSPVAPVDGILVWLRPGLQPGAWVGAEDALALVAVPGMPRLTAVIEQESLGLVQPGAKGRLWLDGRPDQSLAIEVGEVFTEAVQRLDEPLLAASHGGPVAVRTAPDGAVVPEIAHYRLALRPTDRPEATRLPLIKTRGYAVIETAPRNLIGRIIDRVVGVFRREFG